jgi:transcriptional regulator with XRE-family HTH domain
MAAEVRRYRQERSMSAQQLADRCAALGAPIDRTVIANLENGRRPFVSVAEVLVLAAALEVSPLVLAIPLGRRELIEILPGVEISPWDAADWWQGHGPGVAISEAGRVLIGPYESDADLRLVRAERAAQEKHPAPGELALTFQAIHGRVLALAEDVLAAGSGRADLAPTVWGALSLVRQGMRDLGLIPPPLPPELARMEERGADVAQADPVVLSRPRIEAQLAAALALLPESSAGPASRPE